MTAELVLGIEPDAVPRARRFATALLTELDGRVDPELVTDAELVVTELVTNAALHGAPPIALRLIWLPERVRIEVEDVGRALPVRPRHSLDAMTGRGLALVAQLAAAWGVDPGGAGGKTVWAELTFERPAAGADLGPDLDVEALLASWDDDEADGPLYEVHLGSVPTDLLLEAKSHIDNVVRELTLLRAGEATSGVALPQQMARLVATVTEDFARPRAAIKAQAIDAAHRGDGLTDLVLRLPLSAAAAGERYLAALDEADRYARAARLLTLAPRPAHRAFRRWYVQGIVDQLRAVASGEVPEPLPLFPQVLAAEVDRLSKLQETADRLQLLQKVTSDLTSASSVQDVADSVVENAGRMLGVETARVFERTEQGTLRSLAWHGRPAAGADRDPYEEFPVEADLPGAIVARTGQPWFMRSLADIYARFPQLEGYYPSERCLHLVPVTMGEINIGLLAMTFLGGELEEEDQREFVGALAASLAQALERARAMERAERAAERLSFLADASVALSATLDFGATVEAVSRLMVPRLADWCVVQVERGGTLETVALLHFDPEKVTWARAMEGRYPTRMDAPTGAPAVLRSGRSELYPEIAAELVAQSALDADHLRIIGELGMTSGLVVPLTGRSGTFGAVTLIYAESGRHYSEEDVPFVEDVARRAALALETAQTFQTQSGRLATVSRVAEAAQMAILAPVPPRVGPVNLAARYVSAAAEALIGGDLYEVVPRPDAVRLLIADVRGKGLAAVRLATVVLGEFRGAAADLAGLDEVARQMDRRVQRHLGEEDFVTALLVEIGEDGALLVASCGHPPPLLARAGAVWEVPLVHGLPLGLGSDPPVSRDRLVPGDRLLLYTDGVLEARDPSRRFVDLFDVAAHLGEGTLDEALEEVLDALSRASGAHLSDDLALLAAAYEPSAQA